MTTNVRNISHLRQPIITGTRALTKGNTKRQPSDIDAYLDVKGSVLFSDFKYSTNEWKVADCAKAKLSGGQRIFFECQVKKPNSCNVMAIVRHEKPKHLAIDYFNDVKQFTVMYANDGLVNYTDVYDGARWFDFNNSWNEMPSRILGYLKCQSSSRLEAINE